MELCWKRRLLMTNCVAISILALIASGSISCSRGVDEDARTANGITADDLATYTRELADDSMLGRAPGGEGEAPTLAYLQAAYERIGLRPMGNAARPGSPPGSPTFFQEVELVGIGADPGTAALSFRGSTETEALELRYGSEFVTWTPEPKPLVHIDADLVFVGYGIDAPEEEWDDYRGVDVTDKIVLVLVGDPPLEDQSRFGGKAMTSYGRYTYKIRRGRPPGRRRRSGHSQHRGGGLRMERGPIKLDGGAAAFANESRLDSARAATRLGFAGCCRANPHERWVQPR